MRLNKMNKFEKRDLKKSLVSEAMSGSGIFVYKNRSACADLTLPRATASGTRKIPPNGQFQGDSYYMQMVKTGELQLVEVVQTPEQALAAQQEAQMAEEKLILDQPEIITEQGTVEHVVDKKVPKQKLNEGGDQKQPDILLNESPPDDGFIIVG